MDDGRVPAIQRPSKVLPPVVYLRLHRQTAVVELALQRELINELYNRQRFSNQTCAPSRKKADAVRIFISTQHMPQKPSRKAQRPCRTCRCGSPPRHDINAGGRPAEAFIIALAGCVLACGKELSSAPDEAKRTPHAQAVRKYLQRATRREDETVHLVSLFPPALQVPFACFSVRPRKTLHAELAILLSTPRRAELLRARPGGRDKLGQDAPYTTTITAPFTNRLCPVRCYGMDSFGAAFARMELPFTVEKVCHKCQA